MKYTNKMRNNRKRILLYRRNRRSLIAELRKAIKALRDDQHAKFHEIFKHITEIVENLNTEHKRDISGNKPFMSAKAGDMKNYKIQDIDIKVRFCPSGEFEIRTMRRCEPHTVKIKISEGFWIMETPVSQALYEKVMGYNPSHFSGYDLPVEQVSWENADEFCRHLSVLTGMEWRLPTEAEWEYACKADSCNSCYNHNGSSMISDHTWYYSNSHQKTQPISQKLPNSWKIHDMQGNVFEWCSDWFGEYPSENCIDPIGPLKGVFKVIRGGSWYDFIAGVSCSRRHKEVYTAKSNSIGFRAVCKDDKGL